jgi:protein O-GlcNAc transferase
MITDQDFERAKNYFLLGLEMLELKKYEEAEKYFRLSLSLLPDRLSTLTNLAATLIKLKSFDAAEDVILKSINLFSEDELIQFIHGDLMYENGKWLDAITCYDTAIRQKPDYAEAYSQRGLSLSKLNRFEEALASYNKSIQLQSDHANPYFYRGNTLQQLNRIDEALDSYNTAIKLGLENADVFFNLGNAQAKLARLDVALASHDRAITIDADFPEAWCARGDVLQDLGRYNDALASYNQAINLNSDFWVAYANRGLTLQALGRLDEALLSHDHAITINPQSAQAFYNRGVVLQALKRFEDAVSSYDQTIKINSNHAEAFFNRGNALQKLRRYDEALNSYDQAIKKNPCHAEAYLNRGNTLQELNRLEEASFSYDQALTIKPGYAEAFHNRGNALRILGRLSEALESYDHAIKIKANYAEAYSNRGKILVDLKRFDEALASYSQAMTIDRDLEYGYGEWLYTKFMLCDWADCANRCTELLKRITDEKVVAFPFAALVLTDSLAAQRKVAEISINQKFPENHALGTINKRTKNKKIRIGYYSADFREHPVGFLTAELFEKHDKENFELYAFYSGPATNDLTHKRIRSAFDQFIDIRKISDKDVAQLSRELAIDVAVDLTGWTQDMRIGIFSYRAAPVQVNFLGYAGTIGASYYDYLVADNTVIPEINKPHFSEKIIYLPNSLMPRDRTCEPSNQVFQKSKFYLPENKFVYCAFNGNYKIHPRTFDSWIKILKKVPGSVLWLSNCHTLAKTNLRREAEMRGVSADRLVFADRLDHVEDHFARHRLADLFLDTIPYNAHTTASDALWSGLPVLTCMGESFASRVAASLLNAIGLPELITNNQEQYEALAIELALNPEKLGTIKQRLDKNRLTSPLFDTDLLTKHLEAAYTQMYERYHADLPPEHFHVNA